MTISSAAEPDLKALCSALVGRDAIAADRIGGGRNSRVFRVSLADAGPQAPSSVVVKFYPRDPGDRRDRLAAEFLGLQFLWQNGVRAIPCPIAMDRERYCAIYEYIAGEVADARHISARDIDAAVDFLSTLKALRARPGSADLPVASEACFSLEAMAANLVERFERLQQSSREKGREEGSLHAFLTATFEPLMRDSLAWCRATASRAGLSFHDELSARARTLSPSDFGFHNAIRRAEGALAFVDFEYFGWDDPAKTVVDFILHPGMTLSEELRHRFVGRCLAAFADVSGLSDRVRIVYPMFGLKWCLIVLNEFLTPRMPASMTGASITAPGAEGEAALRAAQLAKAEAMVQRLHRQDRDNPWPALP